MMGKVYDFESMEFDQLVNSMQCLRHDTFMTLIPDRRKKDAKFAGYRFGCWGAKAKDGSAATTEEDCDFRIEAAPTITRDTYDKLRVHLQEHKSHSMQCYAEYDIPSS